MERASPSGRSSRWPSPPPPEPLDLSLQEGRARLWAWGAGPPLLLLHGLGALGRFWEPLAPFLAPQARLLAPDLPGHGESAPLPSPTLPEGVRWLVRLLDALGLDRVSLVGHSLGGTLALALALRCPERVLRLVLIAPPGLGPAVGWPLRLLALPRVGPFLYALLGRWPSLALRGLVHDPRTVPRDLLDRLARQRRRRGGQVLRLLRQGVGPRGLHSPLLPEEPLRRLPHPVLLVWGAEDRTVPLENGLRGLALLPRSRLAVLPACGHWPPVERPEAVAFLVDRFLGQG